MRVLPTNLTTALYLYRSTADNQLRYRDITARIANTPLSGLIDTIPASPTHGTVLIALGFDTATAERLRLLYVGRLHTSKGVQILLEALDGLGPQPGFTLDVLGSGPDEAEWRAQYGDRPWLRFAGHVSLQTVADRMENSDLLLVPSIWNENSPGVIIQALLQGLPVMGSDKGGIPELVQHGENGLLVPAGDVAAWRAAVAGLVANPEQLAPLRANALAASGRFAKTALSHEALAVFEQILAGAPEAIRAQTQVHAGAH